MREELRCALNDAELTALDPRLYIEDIEERVKLTAEPTERPGYGLILTAPPRRESVTVVIHFMIKERDRAQRAPIISRVNGWAKSGWLTVSTRPGQRMYAHCTQAADSETLRWSGTMRLGFTAYEEACWQDRFPVTAQITGREGSAALRPGGTRDCGLAAEIVNRSGNTVNSLRLAVNGRKLEFAGLALGDGQRMMIDHDERGLLRAGIGEAPALCCMKAGSDDDLKLHPGAENTVTFTADGACAVTLQARGTYD